MDLITSFPFTEKRLKALKPLAKKCQYSDERLSNLKLIVTPTNTKTYYVVFKVKGKTNTIKLGRLEELSLDDARARAVEFINNTKEQRQRTFVPPDLARLKRLDKLTGFTVDQAYQSYFDNHLRHKKNGSGKRQHALHHTYTNYLKAELGLLDVAELNRKWLAKFVKNIFFQKGYSIHNKCVSVLKAMFNYCMVYEEDYPLEYSPASLLKKEAGASRSRYLSLDEIRRLLLQLDKLAHPQLTDLFKLALFTGARISNIKAMRWDEVDFANAIWVVPAVKTKTNKTYHLPLSEQALAILLKRQLQPYNENGFVFPSNRAASGHVTGGDSVWKQVIKQAGLYSVNRDIRIRKHDLRRTFATLQALKGVDINTISKTLGHTDIKNTQIYAQLNTLKTKAAINLAFEGIG